MDQIIFELYEAHCKHAIPLKYFRVSHKINGDLTLVDVAQNYPYPMITIEDYFKHIGG